MADHLPHFWWAKCAWCGVRGQMGARFNEHFYCHPITSNGPTCYEQAQFDAEVQANDNRLFKALGLLD